MGAILAGVPSNRIGCRAPFRLALTGRITVSTIISNSSPDTTRRLPFERTLEVIFAIASLAALAFLLRPLFLETASRPEPQPTSVTTHSGETRVSSSGLMSEAQIALTSSTMLIAGAEQGGPNLATAAAAIADARAVIASCRETYRSGVKDYICDFHKRERVDGKMVSPHQMHMKARNQPSSIYFKFVTPNKGREAIYHPGKFGPKLVAHDVGLGRLLAGTLHLDPKGSMAMDENRHPVSEAGLGSMLDTVSERWQIELSPEESVMVVDRDANFEGKPCIKIDSIHTERRPDFFFHKVTLFIDKGLNLPVRFEAYDWPKADGTLDLVEEYTYRNLKVNAGLAEIDFDPSNPKYKYGRF